VLQALAGLVRPQRGRIAADGEVWFDSAAGIDLPPERRSVGWVPQDHGLFPHMDVRANVAFGARDPGAVDGLLERLGVLGLAAERPAALSGGERQRVALARALAREPAVLALDEPLAALDAVTRARVRDELAATLAGLAVPALLVTHDFTDAAALADRVAVLVDGRLRQLGTPQELVRAPADPFVVALTGGSVVGGLALQPWQVRVGREPPGPGRDGFEGEVAAVAPEGARLRVRVGDVVGEATAPVRRGERVWVSWATSDAVPLPGSSKAP
jgi:molybdate transport system ATP-binding protein